MVTARSAAMTIMKYQVSVGDYQRCVLAGTCKALETADRQGADVAVTGVNLDDAQAYARWLSAQTGAVWTVPSHEQIAFAAGSKFPDDSLGIDPDSRNPALRWLADYDRETRRAALKDIAPRQRGHYGGERIRSCRFRWQCLGMDDNLPSACRSRRG